MARKKMTSKEPTTSNVANFIIAGTPKAGTTSLFTYLSNHPAVCAGRVKETDFFRQELHGSPAEVLRGYAGFFSHCRPEQSVIMEASPSYLVEATSVAPRIRTYLPDVRLLFVLRNPVDRLQSSFQFHSARLHLPKDMTFAQYVEQCIAYEGGASATNELRLDPWYLKMLSSGVYVDGLRRFFAEFPHERIKVAFFDDLAEDVRQFMYELSEFLGIDKAYWERYEFHAENVTFSSRFAGLHKLALWINDTAEPLLRRFPAAKRKVLSLYKRINAAKRGYEPMDAEVRRKLIEYYRPGNADLESLIGSPLPKGWTC